MSIAREAIEFILSAGFSGRSGFAPTKEVKKDEPTTNTLLGSPGSPSDARAIRQRRADDLSISAAKGGRPGPNGRWQGSVREFDRRGLGSVRSRVR